MMKIHSYFNRIIGLVVISISCLLILVTASYSQSAITIPQSSDWVDRGLVLDTGTPGVEWDVLMEGLNPCSIIKKDGTYFLYYVGSDDYIPRNDNIGPANRSIGVATSTDGVNWTKYGNNPVVTWSVTGNEEEGAPSFGVYLDENGDFVAYYGANTSLSINSNQVNADVRLAISSNGLDFTDQGQVVDHLNPGVWGNGDELHSNMGFKSNNSSYAFYVPNGVPQSSKLGVAWGTEPDNLTNSAPVLDTNGTNIDARGPASIVSIDSDTLAFFINFGNNIVVRTTSPDMLNQLSLPVETYNNFDRAIVLLDTERNTWFMYYDNWTHIGLKTAPVGAADTTAPGVPPGVTASAVSDSEVNLTWGNAIDGESGILEYKVYRDGFPIGTTRSLSFTDKGLSELTNYNYSVSAVNLHGVEGATGSDPVTTAADSTAPKINSISSDGNLASIKVVFNEPVEETSAQNTTHFIIDGGISVFSAALNADLITVVLSTSQHADNGLYNLTVNNVSDRAVNPNVIISEEAFYTPSSITDLTAYWRLDEGAGITAIDSSGFANNGDINNSPGWTIGEIFLGLDLDGIDDFVEIDTISKLLQQSPSNYTYTAWVNLADIPPNTDQDDVAYTILKGPNNSAEIKYDYTQRFFCKISTTDGSYEITSNVIAPGVWTHVALVKDDTAGLLRCYVNGAELNNSPVNYTGNIQEPFESLNYNNYYSQLWIGSSDPMFSWGKYFLHGVVDEVRLYSRALSVTEIQSVYSINEDINNQPVANDDNEFTDENISVNIDVLINDYDPDGDPLSIDNVTQPANGIVVNNGSDVTYTPSTDFTGNDSFNYTVSDNLGGFDTAVVNISVNCTSSCGVVCGNGVCEEGEDCNNCSSDCVSGAVATCGNGICEAGDGEDCNNCPGDCNSKTRGNPNKQFCCGDGGICGNSSCNNDSYSCTEIISEPYCCGDTVCEGGEDSEICLLDCPVPFCGDGTCNTTTGEDSCSCAFDCGSPPLNEDSFCEDGTDNDCDGDVDCSDSDCNGEASCNSCIPTHPKEKGPRCSDGIDNDCDGFTDFADSDC